MDRHPGKAITPDKPTTTTEQKILFLFVAQSHIEQHTKPSINFRISR